MSSTNSFNHPYGVSAAAAATATTASTTGTKPPAEGANKQKGGGTTSMRRLDSAAPNKRNMPSNQYNAQQQHQHQQQQQQQQRDSNASPKRHIQFEQRQQQQQQQQLQKQEQQFSDAIQSEDNLEYFIKFPTPNYRNDAMDTGDSDFVFVYNDSNDSNVPIVMLLGWAGCQDRYLMKYSKIYEDRGLITVRYTAPVDTLFWKRTAMVPIGEKILKLMYDMNFDTHPVIVHIFSNGGAYLYQHISLAMRKYKTPIQIRGMIFDSAPGERRILGLYRAVTAIYGKERKNCHCVTALIITLTLSIMWFVEETFAAFKSLFFKSEPVQTNPFSDLKNDATQFPQLFVYSKGDVVIPYEDIEKFIKIRQERGVHVSAACFEDAEHVKIYTKYPSQYIQCVCSFINNCLSRPFKGGNDLGTVTESGSPTSSIRSVVGGNSAKYD
ncbi:transmembrane protein 53 [Ceratitis capitata]|uniref:transmembrane protein 53 n=1 Tax=Ceratitis capitata TaxID=7213 RepID=UPI000618875A|nr:transmembrane protein 53 [Ceratitis capitata]